MEKPNRAKQLLTPTHEGVWAGTYLHLTGNSPDYWITIEWNGHNLGSINATEIARYLSEQQRLRISLTKP